MNVRTRFLAALVAASVGFGGVVLVVFGGVSPASAASSSERTTPTGPPPGQDWGVAFQTLPTFSSGTMSGSDPGAGCVASGGVSTAPVVANENSPVATPVVISMCDPFSWPQAGGGYFFTISMYMNGDTRPNAVGPNEIDALGLLARVLHWGLL